MTTKVLLSRHLLLGVLILLLGIAYGTQSGGQTMFDDDHQIIHVSAFTSVADTFSVDFLGFFRPIKNLLFYTWSRLFPDQYPVWRLTAVALFLGLIPIVHCVFGLFWKQQPYLQLFCTALWACSPGLTTVVSWISSTNILVGGYGFFLYFLFHEKSYQLDLAGDRARAYLWKFIALLMFALACFSYEAAVTAPVLLGLKEYVLHRDRLTEKRNWVFYGLSFLVLGLYLSLRNIHGGVATFDIATTMPSDSDFWVSLSSGWMYLYHAIRWLWPFGQQGILIMFNPDNHKLLVVAAAILVAGIGVLSLAFSKKAPKQFLGIAWFALALFPMANVIPLRNGPIADYYLFLPSVGLAIFIAWLFHLGARQYSQKSVTAFAACLALLYCGTTFLWTPHWKSQRALAERTVAWQSENFVILESLAKVELEDGNPEKAEAYLNRGLALAPWYSRLYYYKVMMFIDQQRATEATELLDMLMEKQAASPKPFVFQAYVKEKLLGELQEAEGLLTTALEKAWDDRYSRMGAMNLAAIYVKTDRRQFAHQIYRMLSERYPLDTEISRKYQALDQALGAPALSVHSQEEL